MAVLLFCDIFLVHEGNGGFVVINTLLLSMTQAMPLAAKQENCACIVVGRASISPVPY